VSEPELSTILHFEVVVPEALELVIVQLPVKFVEGMTAPPPLQPDKNIANTKNKITK
jgi:hypothetical protein